MVLMMNKPDRPISKFLMPARKMVRLAVLMFYRLRLGRKISCGANVVIGRGATLLPPSKLSLGSNVTIGLNFHLETNLEVGDDVLVSSNVSIVGNDHRFDDPNCSIYFSGRLPPSNVIIEGDNLIGHRVVVVGNVRIGRGCIVGAGSIVTKDLPPYTVCYGVPAKPVRSRFAL
jgi:acetyltransferase-like isoleucine patch superfamily enzyme